MIKASSAFALKRETSAIPIVFVVVSDPVGAGFVESLPRPGGNITGFINLEGSIGGKWVELLREAAPRLKHVAILFNPATAAGGGAYFLPSFEAAARAFGVASLAAPVGSVADIERAIAEAAREPDGGLVIMTDGYMRVNRGVVIALAARHRLPAIFPNPVYVRDGGLMSYGDDSIDAFRKAAPYVDRILRGAKPRDLPVQIPTRYQLLLNLKTAKDLGLDLPWFLQQRADEVIE